MIKRIVTVSAITLISASLSVLAEESPNQPIAVFRVADQVESITDKLYSNSFDKLNRFGKSLDNDMKSCGTDKTAFITVYTTNSAAQNEINVTLDGSPIGSLATHFPDEAPNCTTPSSKGIITIIIPAGKHTIEASSPNLIWPSHSFTVESCECLLLPLS